MPEFRQDFITKEWVIVAPERAKRPDQFKRTSEKPEKLKHDPKCPFCAGNEVMTPEVVLTHGDPKNWTLRVVPNKFAAVNPSIAPERKSAGKFLSAGGFGVAEVVIETPGHDETPALMSKDKIKKIVEAYKTRFSALTLDEKADLITIFRNHGAGAGTSLAHPHSQIIATPIVPPHIRHVMHEASLYHDTYGECPYCVMVEEELSQGERIILAGNHYAVFCPYASRVPFEMKIVPLRHSSRFDSISPDETDELAEILRIMLKKLYIGLDDPDYNYVIRTSPASDGELHYDHWHIAITPRITTQAGFEIGSGIFINSMPPEQGAAFLKGVKVS